MIFKLHYFIFNAGLSGVLVLITVFLSKYSDASSTEVGTLLMILPLIAVFTKPFFCALADRHRRYRLYFILSIVFSLIGFGAYALLPFFPHFISEHGRMAWWILVGLTVIGHISYGVTWSLGDAYAANVAHKTGESFGLIRLWGTVGWGVAGAVVGAVSPYVDLPEMVLGILIFVASFVFEIILLWWWPNNEDFEMGDAIPSHGGPNESSAIQQPTNQQIKSTLNQLATITEKPKALCDLNNNNNNKSVTAENGGQEENAITLALSQLSSGQLSIARTQSNSLMITTKVKLGVEHTAGDKLDRTINELMRQSTRVSLNTHAQSVEEASLEEKLAQELERKKIADLQITIFKMVAMKHKSLIKYLIIFVALGIVYNIHWSYFFLHLERLAHEGKGGSFSTLVGMCLVAQAVGETFCFIIAPWVVSKLGRDGAISLCAITFALRYFGNGLGIPMISPFVAVFTESLQGINYGIFYYLITDTALHYALLVDDIIPDLYALRLIDEKSDLNGVRTSLRATMQGVFSGAFDGLGFGLGSMIAGLVLETHSYEELWCYAGTAAVGIFIVHALYEIINKSTRRYLAKSDSSVTSFDTVDEYNMFNGLYDAKVAQDYKISNTKLH